MIRLVEDAARQFLSDMDEMIEKLNTLNPPIAEPEKPVIKDGITDDDIAWITAKHAEEAQ
jgi:hypothetical protein